MRRKTFFAAAGICLALAILLLCLFPELSGRRPFKDMDGSDIL